MTQEHYTILDETANFILMYKYEDAYLLVKATKEEVYLGDFYGEPTCGVISKINDWCIVAGAKLVVWTENEIIEIVDSDIAFVFEIRQIDKNKVEILIDPYSENASIWEFDVLTKGKRKIKDFLSCKGKEYSDKIEW